MTKTFFKPAITADEHGGGEPGFCPSLQHAFNTVFAANPTVRRDAASCEPFSNDTPAPSGQTMRKPPADAAPKRLTLHLPPRPRVEPGSPTSLETSPR